MGNDRIQERILEYNKLIAKLQDKMSVPRLFSDVIPKRVRIPEEKIQMAKYSAGQCKVCGKTFIEKPNFTSTYMGCPDELKHEKENNPIAHHSKPKTNSSIDWENLLFYAEYRRSSAYAFAGAKFIHCGGIKHKIKFKHCGRVNTNPQDGLFCSKCDDYLISRNGLLNDFNLIVANGSGYICNDEFSKTA